MNKANKLLSLVSEEYKVGDKLSVDWDGPSDIEIIEIDSDGMIHIKRPNYKGNPEENYLTVSSDELDYMSGNKRESTMPESDPQELSQALSDAITAGKKLSNILHLNEMKDEKKIVDEYVRTLFSWVE